MRSTARTGWRSARTGRASTSPRVDSNAVARLNRNTTTGAITQPAGSAGCISEDGAGPCADGHGLDGPTSVAVSPDGKSVYVASSSASAVARLNRNTTTGAITQPAGTAGCVSETGAGPCADGHALDGPYSVAVSPDGKSVYVASHVQRRRGAPQPQHDHRGDHPARRDRRLHQRDGGGALRRRPCARRPARWRSARTGRASTSPRLQRRRGAPQPQHDHRGDRPARRDRRLRQPDGGGALRRRPCARRRAARWRSARTGRASTSPRSTATPWRASTGRPRPIQKRSAWGRAFPCSSTRWRMRRRSSEAIVRSSVTATSWNAARSSGDIASHESGHSAALRCHWPM